MAISQKYPGKPLFRAALFAGMHFRIMCRAYGALVFFYRYPALTRWANFAARLRR